MGGGLTLSLIGVFSPAVYAVVLIACRGTAMAIADATSLSLLHMHAQLHDAVAPAAGTYPSSAGVGQGPFSFQPNERRNERDTPKRAELVRPRARIGSRELRRRDGDREPASHATGDHRSEAPTTCREARPRPTNTIAQINAAAERHLPSSHGAPTPVLPLLAHLAQSNLLRRPGLRVHQ